MSVNEKPTTPGVYRAGTRKEAMTGKFDGATPEELTEYVEGSAQRAGETDSAWAARVQLDEAKLLAKIAARSESVKDETQGGY
jgi:hypothetical protein